MRLVIVGGSDAGITAALRARQLDPGADVRLIVADDYPNFSICGIPYHVSNEVPDWRDLAHRSLPELRAAGLHLYLGERAIAIDASARTVTTRPRDGAPRLVPYDRLIIGTGAVPHWPPIAGLDELGPDDGLHLLHTMDDTFAVVQTVERGARSAVIVGAGYIGLEMAEALHARGLEVTVIEQLPQVLPRTLDPDLAGLIEAELKRNDVAVVCGALVTGIARAGERLAVRTDQGDLLTADLVLVVTGVRPDTSLAVRAGVTTGFGGVGFRPCRGLCHFLKPGGRSARHGLA